MAVLGNLVGGEGNLFHAVELADHVIGSLGTRSLVNRDPALQVGQAKGGLPVAAVGRADQLEEGRVLVDRHQRTVAERPALRREVEADDADFTDEWLSHDSLDSALP